MFSEPNRNIIVFHLVEDNHIEALKTNFQTESWEKVDFVLGSDHCFMNRETYFRSCEINQKIYLVRGYDHRVRGYDEILSSVYVVDKNFHTTRASSMKIGRIGFGMCEFNDRYLLLAGGVANFDYHREISRCEIYDSFADKWEQTSDMMMSRAHFPLVYFNGKILAIGGNSENYGVLDTIESYDIRTKRWTTWSAKLLDKLWCHSAIAVDDKLYVFGGLHQYNECTTVEMYSAESGQFTYVKPMPTYMSVLSCCKRNNCIYLLGKEREISSKEYEVHIYNTELDVWTTGETIPQEIQHTQFLTACSF